jgi:hypothetical protein
MGTTYNDKVWQQHSAVHIAAIDRLACASGNACITDNGVASLAAAPSVMLQQLQEFALDAVHCTWEGVQLLLKRCPGLQKLNLYGLHPCL